MAKILDGTALAKEIRAEVAAGVAEMQEKYEVAPGLAAVLVGDDAASAIYVRNKGHACAEIGMVSQVFQLPPASSQTELIALVDTLNHDPRFHGILVQLPLPRQIDDGAVMRSLLPSKDVDCMHPYNLGKLVQGTPDFVPGTPAGI